MNKKKIKIKEISDLDLLKDLERRFGPAAAQQILEQIKKAEAMNTGQDSTTDYMAVKAVSEAVETYRSDARAMLKRIKSLAGAEQGVAVRIDRILLERRFGQSLGIYKRLLAVYFVLWHHAMKPHRSLSAPYRPACLPERAAA
jgi:hypothetical protein